MKLPALASDSEFSLEHEDLDLEGMKIRCFFFSSGRKDDDHAVVCVHGMAASGASFARLQPLASKYDLRFLSAPVDGYPGDSVGTFATALRHYLTRFHRPVLLGTSWGGLVSLTAASEVWRDLSGLILTGAFARNTIVPPSLKVARNVLAAAQIVAPAAAPVSARVVGGFGIDGNARRELTRQAREVTPQERARRLREVFDADLRETAMAIRTPSIVIQGTSDRLVTRKDARDLADLLPESTYREIDGAGHTPYLSHPTEFNEIVSEFLESRARW